MCAYVANSHAFARSFNFNIVTIARERANSFLQTTASLWNSLMMMIMLVCILSYHPHEVRYKFHMVTCEKHKNSSHTLVYFRRLQVNSVIHMWMMHCHRRFCGRSVWFSPHTCVDFSPIYVYYEVFRYSQVTHLCISDVHMWFTGIHMISRENHIYNSVREGHNAKQIFAPGSAVVTDAH